MKKMKKILPALTVALALAAPMRAQVFVMGEEENARVESENVLGNGDWNNVIVHGSGDDQTNYVPVGDGLLLLAALGGVNLLRKKKINKVNVQY